MCFTRVHPLRINVARFVRTAYMAIIPLMYICVRVSILYTSGPVYDNVNSLSLSRAKLAVFAWYTACGVSVFCCYKLIRLIEGEFN